MKLPFAIATMAALTFVAGCGTYHSPTLPGLDAGAVKRVFEGNYPAARFGPWGTRKDWFWGETISWTHLEVPGEVTVVVETTDRKAVTRISTTSTLPVKPKFSRAFTKVIGLACEGGEEPAAQAWVSKQLGRSGDLEPGDDSTWKLRHAEVSIYDGEKGVRTCEVRAPNSN